MSWQDSIKKGNEIVLSTCSENNPHANVVISLGLVENKLLIADCQMHTTLKNLQKEKRACIVSKNKKEYYCIKGKVEISNSGKYFDLCNKDSEYPAKNAILITVDEVFDLDKVEKIL